jgi:hypothetical protein
VIFGNGIFLALLPPVTYERFVGISTNGFYWTWVPTGNAPDFGIIAFGNGKFVGTHSGYFASTNRHDLLGSVAVSSNGVKWTTIPLVGSSFFGPMAFGNGRFLLTCEPSLFNNTLMTTETSEDGSNWTSYAETQLNTTPLALGFGVDRWYLTQFFDHAHYWTSVDATNWIAHPSPLTNGFGSFGYGDGQFLFAGNYGNLMTSENGLDWTVRSEGSPTNLRAVAQGGGTTVAVGNDGLILTSSNGSEWARCVVLTSENVRGVAWGDGRFIAVANDGIVMASTNGLDWTIVESATSNGLYSVAFSGQRFVAVGEQGEIVTSESGLLWSEIHSPSEQRLNAITWTGHEFVAVGRAGTILSSSDGIGWANVSAAFGNLQGVAFGNGIYVAVGQDLAVVTSTNGIDWTINRFSPPATAGESIEDITFAAGLFAAVGEKGTLLTSADGQWWTERFSGCANDLRAARYIDGRLIAVGNNETIIQSEPYGPPAVLRVRRTGQSDVLLKVLAEAGYVYRLQASCDLRTWEKLIDFAGSNDPIEFRDLPVSPCSHRFFRVVLP